MKSEERHHLQENDLASVLERGLRRIEPYSNQILVGILAATVIAVGAVLWLRSSDTASAAAWAQYAKAASADDFLTTADDHPGTKVAAWAKLRAGELFLNEALRVATSDRKTEEDRLKKAEQALQGLVQDSSNPEPIRERALYALAVCRESLAGPDTQKGLAAYEEFVRQFPESAYRRLADDRIADLKSDSTREFYAWFAEQERNPEDRPKPKELATGQTGGDFNPFQWTPPELDARPANPDRPPSPPLPTRAAPEAAAFPGSESSAPAATDAPPTTDGAAAAPTIPAPTTPAPAPANEAEPAAPPSPAAPTSEAPSPAPTADPTQN